MNYLREIRRTSQNYWSLVGFNPCGITNQTHSHTKINMWRDGLGSPTE
jgi:hypothetical protein